MSHIDRFERCLVVTGGAALAVAVMPVLMGPAEAASTVFRGSGDISGVFADYQAALGDPNNGNAPGQQPAGRREINWDAGIVPFDMPGDFFNTTVPRGAEFTTDAGSEFRVSNPPDTAPGAPDNEFDSINASYPDQFSTFSPQRLFTPVETNVLDIRFFESGTETPATVNGFGAVFTDVDLPDVTKLEFFDLAGTLLASEFVDPASEGLSFLGLLFDPERVARVQLTAGNTAIGLDDDPEAGIDVVVMDDFIYGEPAPVPLPAAMPLLFSALTGLGILAWRKRAV